MIDASNARLWSAFNQLRSAIVSIAINEGPLRARVFDALWEDVFVVGVGSNDIEPFSTLWGQFCTQFFQGETDFHSLEDLHAVIEKLDEAALVQLVRGLDQIISSVAEKL